MATFGITPATGQNDLVGALNYALNNIGQGLTVNKENGQILQPGNEIPYAYVYPYLYIAFADSADGTLNFDQSTYTNKQYYGYVVSTTKSNQPITSYYPGNGVSAMANITIGL